jgi:hypothetical protein
MTGFEVFFDGIRENLGKLSGGAEEKSGFVIEGIFRRFLGGSETRGPGYRYLWCCYETLPIQQIYVYNSRLRGTRHPYCEISTYAYWEIMVSGCSEAQTGRRELGRPNFSEKSGPYSRVALAAPGPWTGKH